MDVSHMQLSPFSDVCRSGDVGERQLLKYLLLNFPAAKV